MAIYEFSVSAVVSARVVVDADDVHSAIDKAFDIDPPNLFDTCGDARREWVVCGDINPADCEREFVLRDGKEIEVDW